MSCDEPTMIRDERTEEVPERGACQLVVYLSDAAGSDLTVARINGVTLTLYDDASDEILNSREGQNILNTNGGIVADVTADLDGNPFDHVRVRLTLTLSGLDHAIAVAGKSRETHVALTGWTFDGGTQGWAEVAFPVVNLRHVP